MRIVVANKFWYRRAGLERVMFDEIGWLADAGHEIAHFSTDHPENDASPWSDYFAPYLEIGPHSSLGPRDKALAAARMFWNSFSYLSASSFFPSVFAICAISSTLWA